MKNFISLLVLLVLTALHSAEASSDTLKQDDSRKLVVGVKDTPPFIIKTNKGYEGVSVELWEELATDLGLQYEYREYSLTGLMKALEEEEVDLSINPLTVTSERVKRFNFTQPFYISSLAIATHKKGENEIWSFIRNFFSWKFFKVVLLLFLVIFFFGFLAWIFERKGNPEEFGGKGFKGVWQGIWWSAVTMTTVGYGDKSPRTVGGQIVALIWMFTAVIIISSFTASIASSLTVNRLESNIKGVEDLKNVRVGSIKGSTSKNYLGSLEISSRDFLKPEEGLKAISSGEIDAFVYDEPVMQHIIKNKNLQGELQILPYTFNKQYYAFSFPSNNSLRELLNPLLLDKIKGKDWQVILGEYNMNQD